MNNDQRFFNIDELSHLPVPMWSIENLFEVGSLTMLYGAPSSYKSFMVLDWSLCMASGRRWNDKATAPSKVLYLLGEGKASLLKRIETWIQHHRINNEEREKIVANFRTSFDVPQMAMKPSVDNLLAQLVSEKFDPKVLVIDTFARSFVGMDENSQKDTGLWIESADRLRQSGFTVILLHHTAKSTEFGLKYRGSSAIMGAMDTAMTMEKDHTDRSRVIMKITKQKDHDEGNPFYFKITPVIGPDSTKENSIVLTPAVIIDEGFTEDGRKIEEAISKLLADHTFLSDRARARRLKELFPSIPTESACQNRLVKARAKLKLNDEGDQIH